jgi:hypothetical protein
MQQRVRVLLIACLGFAIVIALIAGTLLVLDIFPREKTSILPPTKISGTDEYSFQIENVMVYPVNDTSATITWTTTEPSSSLVEYGTTSDYGSSTTFYKELVINHNILITDLEPDTTYYFQIKSQNSTGNEAVIGTKKTIVSSFQPDIIPPVISEVVISNIESSSVKINWITDEKSTSQVKYGKTTSYGLLTDSGDELVSTHSIIITGLDPDTTYYYEIISKDINGNKAVFELNNTFTTLAQLPADTTPPVISEITSSVISDNSAIISWTTNEPSSSQVEYGKTTSYGSTTALDEALVISHSVSLTGLNNYTSYHFKVKSKDATGNEVISENYTFYTSNPAESQVEVGGIIDNDTNWSADNNYILISNVGVPEGVTLTIEPGTKIFVKSNYRLQIEGTLIAQGSTSLPICFIGEEPSYGFNLESGIELLDNNGTPSIIEHCDFQICHLYTEEASPLIQNNTFHNASIFATEGSPIIQYNSLEGGSINFMRCGQSEYAKILNNQISGVITGITVWCHSSSVIISNNIIEDCTAVGLKVATRGDDSIEISNNNFTGNKDAITLGRARALDMSIDLTISNNNFINSTHRHLNTDEYIISDIIATENWWGTTNEVEIEELIYDYNDDLSLPTVIWHPFRTSPVQN